MKNRVEIVESKDINFFINVWFQNAKNKIEEGHKIVWKFELGLENPYFPIDDELQFQSLSLALEQFSKEVFPSFKDETLALCFYRGNLDFESTFLWTERQKANYANWLLEKERQDLPFSKKLFCADTFALYFQMLSYRVPDEVPIFLLFDVDFSSPFQTLQMISKERFEHFILALRNTNLPMDGFVWDGDKIHFKEILTSQGLIFPQSANKEMIENFDLLLNESKMDLKIIFETFLSEEWDGLDHLIALEDSLSIQGLRKIKGFEVSGGVVEFRGRGI